ncbi:peroxiredoxin [Erysipelothrix urinaevulpis]|uniref:peroxiredoxin n=1 Tax=Erysipelothrix urinaevulpis TaxID=2683717 RepID=UPI00135A5A99|nr:peroxiredoxin [Erysipelothrix urinaevulpis]
MNKGFPVLGERLPTLKVQTTKGDMILPDAYEGKWFVLFSHPGDFTPVCTTEFIGFAKAHDKFKEINTELIGHSIDGVFSHMKWIEWIKEKVDVDVNFPVIADELGRTAMELGMIHEAKGTNTVRAVFIVDDKGILRLIMYYPQEVGRSIDEVLRATKALQAADIHEVAIPENWPHNDFLGDQVIMKPANNVDLANERKALKDSKDVTYLDWWFIHKDINQ